MSKTKAICGVCRVCACTEEDGCPEGCAWVNKKQDLCTACAELDQDGRYEKRGDARSELEMQIDVAKGELEVLELRLEAIKT